VYGRDPSNQALDDFQAESIPGPPPTLLNLSITLIDSLQLEFGLVEDIHVFLEAMRLYWSNHDTMAHGGSPQHIGNCLVFTNGENRE
jgi:hypothetical protein